MYCRRWAKVNLLTLLGCHKLLITVKIIERVYINNSQHGMITQKLITHFLISFPRLHILWRALNIATMEFTVYMKTASSRRLGKINVICINPFFISSGVDLHTRNISAQLHHPTLINIIVTLKHLGKMFLFIVDRTFGTITLRFIHIFVKSRKIWSHMF